MAKTNKPRAPGLYGARGSFLFGALTPVIIIALASAASASSGNMISQSSNL